jgi:hypothetical protein
MAGTSSATEMSLAAQRRTGPTCRPVPACDLADTVLRDVPADRGEGARRACRGHVCLVGQGGIMVLAGGGSADTARPCGGDGSRRPPLRGLERQCALHGLHELGDQMSSKLSAGLASLDRHVLLVRPAVGPSPQCDLASPRPTKPKRPAARRGIGAVLALDVEGLWRPRVAGWPRWHPWNGQRRMKTTRPGCAAGSAADSVRTTADGGQLARFGELYLTGHNIQADYRDGRGHARRETTGTSRTTARLRARTVHRAPRGRSDGHPPAGSGPASDGRPAMITVRIGYHLRPQTVDF